MPVKPWRRAQVIGTREHLIETAAGLFAHHGYAATPLERVVAEAGLTRGAVYHHFADKRELFAAAMDRVLRDLVYAVEKRAVQQAARAGRERPAETVLLLAEELAAPRAHRIVCLDGPAVLGHERWSELLGRQLLEPLRRGVEAGASAHGIPAALAPAIARLLFGAVQEASLHAARESEDAADLVRALGLLADRLLEPGGGGGAG